MTVYQLDGISINGRQLSSALMLSQLFSLEEILDFG